VVVVVGVLDGVASDLLEDSPDDPELLELAVLVESEEPPESPGLELAYRSLYQPPPFRWNAAAVICLASAPPQELQVSTGGSLIFWRCSSRAPHPVQR
jgi:hypothetical protein